MTVKKITIKKENFEIEIRNILEDMCMAGDQIINVTEDDENTTLWYWIY